MARGGHAHLDPAASGVLSTQLNAGSPSILGRLTGINGTVSGVHNIYTVPAGQTAIVTAAIVRLQSASSISQFGVAGVGIGVDEQDIFASNELTGLDSTNEMYVFASGLCVRRAGVAGEIIKFGLDTPFVGSAATLNVDLIGYVV